MVRTKNLKLEVLPLINGTDLCNEMYLDLSLMMNECKNNDNRNCFKKVRKEAKNKFRDAIGIDRNVLTIDSCKKIAFIGGIDLGDF